jgi:FdhD protein
MAAEPSPFDTRPAMRWNAADGSTRAIGRDVPVETPIGLAYGSRPYVVLMGSPRDVEDLAVGFTITERIAAFSAIERVTVSSVPEGLLADVLLTRGAEAGLARRRALEARSSCGLCGVERLSQAVRPMAPLGEGPVIDRRAIQAALAGLEAGQTLGARTRATHAAAWTDADGRILALREDVGRHNALDKLVGSAARAGLDPARAMIVITSRCSYEMVEKTAAAGVAALIAISAPTALAVEQARAAGMTLIALARGDGHTVFAGGHRLAGS